MQQAIERRTMRSDRVKKVLCVCDMNLRRSPTAQTVLSQDPFNFDTRSAGIIVAAVVKLRPTLLHWADEIVCMDEKQADFVRKMLAEDDGDSARRFAKDRRKGDSPKIIVLNIPDVYRYGDPELKKLIAEKYRAAEKREGVPA